MLASLVRSSQVRRHIWGYDAWAPSLATNPIDLGSAGSETVDWTRFNASKEKVWANLKRHGFELEEATTSVTLVEGLFAETLPNYAGPRIALLHIDVDLYQSYKDCLGSLWPKVGVGGVVALDEYNSSLWHGARPAVDEFLSTLPDGAQELHHDDLINKNFLVKRA